MKTYIISAHGSVSQNGVLMKTINLEDSVVTFHAPYGSPCYVIGQKGNGIILAHGSRQHKISSVSDLNVNRVRESLQKCVYTYTKTAPNMMFLFDEPHEANSGIFLANDNGIYSKTHYLRKGNVSLQDIIRRFGPAHYHVSACRTHFVPAGQNNQIRKNAAAKNRFSSRSSDLQQISTKETKFITNFLKQTLIHRLSPNNKRKPAPLENWQTNAIRKYNAYNRAVEQLEEQEAATHMAALTNGIFGSPSPGRTPPNIANIQHNLEIDNIQHNLEIDKFANTRQELLQDLQKDLGAIKLKRKLKRKRENAKR